MEEDVDFVVQVLPSIEPCTVPDFVRQVGFDPRPHGQPSTVYARILAAFRKGEREGRLTANGRKWRVAQEARARA